MANSSLHFLPYSLARRSRRRAPKPEPVPPPKEWKIRKPCRELQLSVSLSIPPSLQARAEGCLIINSSYSPATRRIRSMTLSTNSLPMV